MLGSVLLLQNGWYWDSPFMYDAHF
jgi:hypothetical protein